MNKYAVVVAGGKGMRMGGEIPKQFLPVGGIPVLMRTLEAFYHTDISIRIILVLPREQQSYWTELCHQYNFRIPYVLADGGVTRFHSVKQGLEKIPESEADALIAVHDGVRPFVSSQVIIDCYEGAIQHGAVVPVLDMIDSVRFLDKDGNNHAIDRSLLKLVQTPQTFRADILKSAYSQPFSDLYTDDASVVEASGIPVALITGNRENIKLITPYDLKVAEILVK